MRPAARPRAASAAPPPPRMEIAPLTREHAVEICTWWYAPPYDCYDMTGADPYCCRSRNPVSRCSGVGRPTDRVPLVRPGRSRARGGPTTITRSTPAAVCDPSWSGGGSAASHLGRPGVRPRATFAPPAFRVTVASFNALCFLRCRRVPRLPPRRSLRRREGRTEPPEVLVRPEIGMAGTGTGGLTERRSTGQPLTTLERRERRVGGIRDADAGGRASSSAASTGAVDDSPGARTGMPGGYGATSSD